MGSVQVIDIDDSDDDMGSERTAQKVDTIDHFEPVFKMVEEIETEIQSVRQFFDRHRLLTAPEEDTESAADKDASVDEPKADVSVVCLSVERPIEAHVNEKMLFKCLDCNQTFATDDAGVRRLNEHYVCGERDCQFRATYGCLIVAHEKVCANKMASISALNTNRQNGVSIYRCDYVHCAQSFRTATQLKNHKSKAHVFDRPYTCDNCGAVLANTIVNRAKHILCVKEPQNVNKKITAKVTINKKLELLTTSLIKSEPKPSKSMKTCK